MSCARIEDKAAPSKIAERYEDKLEVVVFSGGRGTHSLTDTLLRHRQLRLTVIINAYDDGLSTGRIRKFVPGLLGPSDVRKNISRMMQCTESSQRALKALSDLRLPDATSFEKGLWIIDSLAALNDPALPSEMGQHLRSLSLEKARAVAGFCAAFAQYVRDTSDFGVYFDFGDCAVGNVIFAGCFLEQQRDFNQTIDALSKVYDLRGTLLNITCGENLFLMARTEDGTFLQSEAEIVSQTTPHAIRDLFLVEESAYRDAERQRWPINVKDALTLIEEASRLPKINERARQAIEAADVIIYGPGTQHSSLFPSYLTLGFAESVASNQKADKIFLSNIARDVDIQRDDVASLVDKFMRFANRYGECQYESSQLITHYFFQDAGPSSEKTQYLAFNRDTFGQDFDRVRLANWESDDGKHAGGRVLEEILAIVQSHITILLGRVHREISVVVPVLNEAATLSRVLTELQALDLGDLELNKEIIVVDGGSSDDSIRIASSFRGVRLITLPRGTGKGEAMRAGMAKSVGNIIVFFPADGEYECSEIRPLLTAIVKDGYSAVFGSRAIKCMELNQRLRATYGDAKGLFIVSKYGGIALSMMTLLLYNRYVSDVLTSAKAFDRRFLMGLQLGCRSFDIEAEMVAKTALAGEYILEVPINFKPRTRQAGKKIRLMDGIRCLKVLLTCRIQQRSNQILPRLKPSLRVRRDYAKTINRSSSL